MAILAYSGVANEISALSSTASQHFIQGTADKSISITLPSDGILLSFFAQLNITQLSCPSGSHIFTYTISRNGVAIFTQSQNVSTNTTTLQVIIIPGIVLYETLAFLAGCEVKSGDVFTLKIANGLSAAGDNVDYTLSLFATVRNQPKTFQI